MPDTVHVQLTQAHSYLAQLIEQFARIGEKIEQGQTVTFNLNGGGRTLALRVSLEQVDEEPAPTAFSSPRGSSSRSDNTSLVAAMTNTYSFDLGETNRKIASRDVHRLLMGAATRSPASAAVPLQPALPNPAVTFDDPDWILVDDCCYVALDGSVLTAKRGFRSDLASIPRLLWAIIASFELSLIAPIMHDVLYRCGGELVLPHGEVVPSGRRFERKEADDLFLELMTRAKIAYWKRNVAYLAVRAFGQSSWQET